MAKANPQKKTKANGSAAQSTATIGIEADFVDCMVALPGQLFYSTQIPVCLWFLAKNKNADARRGFRDHKLMTAPAHSAS